ncbi:MAG: hypothetical protein AB2L24_30955 [Mangrovibacterium sp.]
MTGINNTGLNFTPADGEKIRLKDIFITEDHYYSIVEIDGDLSSTSNINFLKSLRLKSQYAFVNDSLPFYKRNQIDAVFDVNPFRSSTSNEKQRLSVFFSQTANIDQVTIGQGPAIELSTPRARYETIYLPDARGKDPQFWEQNRLEELSRKQKEIELIIDSISRIRVINLTNKLARMTMTGYYDVGKFEIGPFYSFFNTNKVENMHYFFGGRTSTEISEKNDVLGRFRIWNQK